MSRCARPEPVTLDGFATMRGVTLAWPRERVRRFLPPGLCLGPQPLTPGGTHPVVLLFYDVVDAAMSVPAPLPALTYREHIVGVPYTLAPGGRCRPHFYMARLKLDSPLAMSGGVAFWGFTKELARVCSTRLGYAVCDLDGEALLRLDHSARGRCGPVRAFPRFELLRGALDQPLVSLFPMGSGPVLLRSSFVRDYGCATLRPIAAAVTVERPFVPGMPAGRFPARGFFPGVDVSALGGFELETRWHLGLPRPLALG